MRARPCPRFEPGPDLGTQRAPVPTEGAQGRAEVASPERPCLGRTPRPALSSPCQLGETFERGRHSTCL